MYPKKFLVILFFSILSGFTSFSQYFFYNDNYYDKDLLWEVGGSFGLMKGVTDVGAEKGARLSPTSYNWNDGKPNVGVYFQMLYKSVVGARLEVTRGSISGNDKNSNSPWIVNRNLNFKSTITEVSLVGTLHPLMLGNYDAPPLISPYLVGGIAYFSFYPKAQYNSQWVALRPLHTEGQTFSEYGYKQQYSLTQFAIPFGVGLKYEISPFYNVRMEALYRHTFTDYLDDVSTTYIDPAFFGKYLTPETAKLASQLSNRNLTHSANIGSPRGDTNSNDTYFTLNVKLGFVLGRKKIRG